MVCVKIVEFSICLNGERYGYFKGGMSLTQGDLISPYLFTWVMEILTLIIQRRIRNMADFKYHHGCKELQLVNLCFVDDLMIFCHGDAISTSVIKESIEEFSGISDLLPNLSKSFVFFGRLNNNEKGRIMGVMEFIEGTLPTKYLGVPLVTKMLGVHDCKGLIDKIKGRTEEWKSKYISFAGRLVSIVDVLELVYIGHLCSKYPK